jgi:hypothetical protein
MKGKTLVYIGIYAVVAYGAYYLYFSKTAYAKKIIAAGKYNGTLDDLKTFDMSFLRDWSKAVTANQPTFSHKGKNYKTQGGRAAK